MLSFIAAILYLHTKLKKKKIKMTRKTVKVKLPVTLKPTPMPHSKSSMKKKKNPSVSISAGQPVSFLTRGDVLASCGGQKDSVAGKIASDAYSMMTQNKFITDAGKSSVEIICNPCGEHKFASNVHFPDGALSQSGCLKLRQFETISPPWGNVSSSPNTTDNWGLKGLCPPTYKTIAILIASRLNEDPDPAVMTDLINEFNSEEPSIWPMWKQSSARANYWLSVYEYASADINVTDPTRDRKVESFRIVGDGFVVMHNTPTLWDQGSFAVGQFQTDMETTPVPDNVSSAVLTLNTGAQLSSTQVPFSLQWQGVTLAAGTITIAGASTLPVGLNAISGTLQYSVYSDQGQLMATYTGPGTGILYFAQVAAVAPNPPYVVVTGNSGPGTVRIGLTAPNSTITQTLSIEGPAVTRVLNTLQNVVWTLPPTSQRDIAQADPKFSAELMKQHQGFYAVRRYFEPKLRMTDLSSGGRIKLSVPEVQLISVNAPRGGIPDDVIDVNGSSIMFSIRGISYAANPTIKSCRYIEFLPSPGSSLAPFTEDTPEKDEDAEEIFRQMQLSGPHSYIPDANALGFLSSLIMSTIEMIPVFARGARGVSHAIASAVDWAEDNLFSKIPVV